MTSEKNRLLRSGILKSDKEWQAIFDSSPGASVFQSPDWAHRMVRCLGKYQVKPFVFEFADGTQVVWSTLQGPMNRLFHCLYSMPLGIYGRPIVRGEWSPEKGRQILGSILAGRRLEMRCVEDPTCSALSFALPSGVTQQHLPTETHVLELPESWDVMWQRRFSCSMRNQIRKVEKMGLTLRRGLSPADVDSFYQLYAALTKVWGYARPPHSRRFFLTLMENAPETLQLLLVEDQSTTIAGQIVVEDAYSILCWYGVLDRAAMKKNPMRLLIPYVIREAISKGKPYLNLGQSGNLKGVRMFKELWGAKAIPHNTLVVRRDSAVTLTSRAALTMQAILRRQ